jgi:uncharacterized repeat protein (TIGR03803 family)
MRRRSALKTVLAVLVLCAASATIASAQTFALLHSFDWTDGSLPTGALVQGRDGRFYGVVEFGGLHGDNETYHGGVIYSVGRYGKLEVLYNFCSLENCIDGEVPQGALVQGTYGNLYGVTLLGGATGDGTVFSLTSGGSLETVYSFCSQSGCPDGAYPETLILGLDEKFHGLLLEVGQAPTQGAIFTLTRDGKLTIDHLFCSETGCPDGMSPQGLIQVANGSFYGVANTGGLYVFPDFGLGAGTIYRYGPGGFSTLHTFCSASDCADGASPGGIEPLVEGTDGDVYGITQAGGGPTGGYGTVYKINPAGDLTTLHRFTGQDGAGPEAILQASDGNFYGVTEASFAADSGTVLAGTIFRMTPSGTLTTLHTFNLSEGLHPVSLVQGTDGAFYGTAFPEVTNENEQGTVYRFDVGLPPFVRTLQAFGPIGAHVVIIGNNLQDATSVSFNGTAATFKACDSGFAIDTTVPEGATSGPLTVMTPEGTLTSNTSFTVLP